MASADVLFVPEKQDIRMYVDRAHILVSGEIVADDVDELRRVLAQRRKILGSTPLVVLNSPGGSVVAALEMGRIIRDTPGETAVEGGGSCSSSCVFLHSAGVMRNVFGDGLLGLHRPRFDYEEFAALSKLDARTAYAQVVEACEKYMREMGISDEVFKDMLRIPSHEIRFVDRDYAEQHDLVGKDPAWEEWMRARDVKQKGETTVLAWDQFKECANENYQLGFDKYDCAALYREIREADANAAEK